MQLQRPDHDSSNGFPPSRAMKNPLKLSLQLPPLSKAHSLAPSWRIHSSDGIAPSPKESREKRLRLSTRDPVCAGTKEVQRTDKNGQRERRAHWLRSVPIRKPTRGSPEGVLKGQQPPQVLQRSPEPLRGRWRLSATSETAGHRLVGPSARRNSAPAANLHSAATPP